MWNIGKSGSGLSVLESAVLSIIVVSGPFPSKVARFLGSTVTLASACSGYVTFLATGTTYKLLVVTLVRGVT